MDYFDWVWASSSRFVSHNFCQSEESTDHDPDANLYRTPHRNVVELPAGVGRLREMYQGGQAKYTDHGDESSCTKLVYVSHAFRTFVY